MFMTIRTTLGDASDLVVFIFLVLVVFFILLLGCGLALVAGTAFVTFFSVRLLFRFFGATGTSFTTSTASAATAQCLGNGKCQADP